VEASEIHLVLHLCQAGLIRTDKYRITANRFRRHDKLFEAFGLAVGAFVCASAPFTLGAATTRYERDLQYEYKKNATALFVYCLQQNMGGMNAAELEEDYVARIARLIVVWPDEDGGGKRRIGFKRPGGGRRGDDDDGDDKGGDLKGMVLDSVVSAQDTADRAQKEVEKLKGKFEACTALWEAQRETGVAELEGSVAAAEQRIKDGVLHMHDNFARTQQLMHSQEVLTLFDSLANVTGEIKCLAARFSESGAPAGGVVSMDTDDMEAMRNQIRNMGIRIENFAASVYEGILPPIKVAVDGMVGEHLRRQDGIDQALAARINGVETGLQAKVDGAAFARLIEAIRAAQATADANATAIAQAQADIKRGDEAIASGVTASETMAGDIEVIFQGNERLELMYNALQLMFNAQKAALDAPDSGAQLEKASAVAEVEKASAVAEGREITEIKTRMDEIKARMDEITEIKTRMDEIKARMDEIAEIKTRMDELQKEFDDRQSELDARFDSMNKSFADELTIGGDWEPASRPASATGEEATGRPESSKRRRADSTAEPTAVRPTQKVADMVKSVTDAYLNSMDLNGRINRKVRDVWAEEGVAHLKMDVDGAGGAAPPADPSQFERRLRLLEVLFFDTTSVNTIDPTAQPAFDTPAPPPGTGNFLADPAAV
jgi:tetrahydromethanopterin S-methyltransferase subunit G